MEWRELLLTGSYQQATNLAIWPKEYGSQQTKGTHSKVPKRRKVTYIRKVCTYHQDKAEPNKSQFTSMGNFITNFTGKISTKTAGLKLTKLHWNSVLSTKNAKYMTVNISNMYLNTTLDWFKYMRMPITDIPQEILYKYDLQDIVSHEWIYMEIRKALYLLK